MKQDFKLTPKVILIYVINISLSFIFISPIIFMLVSSFKPRNTIFQDARSLRAFLPTTFTLENYEAVFNRTDFPRFLFNSVVIVVITVAIGILVNSMMAYALSRIRWKGRKAVLAVIIALLIIPFEAIAIPLLFVVAGLPWPGITGTGEGILIFLERTWLNSLHVQMIPFMADAFSIFLFYQFFIDLPKDLDEAALVDGAGRWRIYWNILLPISRPVIATVAILQFLTRWGDYLWPTLSVQSELARPLTVGMGTFFDQTPDWGQIMAYASMITIPVLVIFLLFQKWFVQSVATSGIKG